MGWCGMQSRGSVRQEWRDQHVVIRMLLLPPLDVKRAGGPTSWARCCCLMHGASPQAARVSGGLPLGRLARWGGSRFAARRSSRADDGVRPCTDKGLGPSIREARGASAAVAARGRAGILYFWGVNLPGGLRRR